MMAPIEPYVLPEPLETAEVPLTSGSVTVLRRHGNPDGDRLLMSHGNGLAADFYYPFWSLFLDEFEVVVYDCRNHGWNRTGPQEEHNPRVFAEDLDEAILPGVERAFGRKPTVGCFHSISALASLLLPSRAAGFVGLLLFDPPICRPGISQTRLDRQAEQAAQIMRVREEYFTTHEDFIRLNARSPMLRGMGTRELQLLAETTLRPRANGEGYELRCPPAYEAQALDFLTAYAAIVDIATIRCPVKVIGGDPTVQFAYLPSVDPDVVLAVDYDFVPETAHYLQLERPDVCRDLAMEFFARLGLTAGVGAPPPDGGSRQPSAS